VNGQAIYQTFKVSGEATLSFAYSFQTNDYVPYDSTGYVLDGTYTQLARPTNPYTVPVDPNPTAYVTLSFALSQGTHTLGFIAYNTGDNTASSSLYVTDVSATVAVPEPGEWKLIVFGCVGLTIARKLRSQFSAI
jgi:hypothetical protein